jgi:hypothetical protein
MGYAAAVGLLFGLVVVILILLLDRVHVDFETVSELFQFIVVVECFELWHCWHVVSVDGAALNCSERAVLVVFGAQGLLMV